MATVIAFHAHPDDEVLLTGGTLARLAAEGNRVVIVVACIGGLGSAPNAGVGSRLEELRESASRLGAARVVDLGYADSGHRPVLFPDPPDRVRFARADPDEAAAKLAGLIREEHADVLLSYDAHGGNGHRDHVKVHEVGAHSPVGDHASSERAPVRKAEASGAGGSRIPDRCGRPRFPALLGGDPAPRTCLQPSVRTRVVRRARRHDDHDKRRHSPGHAVWPTGSAMTSAPGT